jgi:DNA-binding IclR family transcriptional regulator
MSRQSPAVGRIVSILNFFVEHPQQAFTLTQIVKSLRLSRATTHAILLGFVDAGYLYRRPDKSYVLGPVLISLAANAQQHFSPLAVARQEMRALADELDVVAAALFAEGSEVVVRERAASLTHLGWVAPTPPQRYPMHPWGTVLYMLLPDAELEAELNKASPTLSDTDRLSVRRELEFARRYGFVAALVPEGDRSEPGNWTPSGHFVSEVSPTEDYRLRFVAAPVRGAAGEAAFGIALSGFFRSMSGAEVIEVGRRLQEACRRISTFIGGDRKDPEI